MATNVISVLPQRLHEFRSQGNAVDLIDVRHDKPVYLICQSGSRARQVAERLIEIGHRNLALVEGGTEAWEKAGLPMQRYKNLSFPA